VFHLSVDGGDAVMFFGHPASMSVPDTSLEFVDGVGVSQRRGDVGMSMASQYQKRPGIESFYRTSKTTM
jgi:hypothetical protein